jgi:hypothetical protein
MRMLSGSFSAVVSWDSDDGKVEGVISGLETNPEPFTAASMVPSTIAPIAFRTIVI